MNASHVHCNFCRMKGVLSDTGPKAQKEAVKDLPTSLAATKGSAGGVCWRSLVANYNIQAPDLANWLADWDNKQFVYWTESVWDIPRIRLFLAPSRAWEILVLLTGLLLTGLTIGAVLLVDKNAATIFPEVFASSS